MIWQDIVIAITNLLFTYSIFIQVLYGRKRKKRLVSLQTSGLTVIGLYAFAIASFTLNLFVSSSVTFINGTLWLVIFIQSIIYPK